MARAGASLRRIELIRRIGFDVGRRSGPRLWRRLRACAWASLALWGAAAVAGAALLGLG